MIWMAGDDTIHGHLGNLRISGNDGSLQRDLDMKSSEILPNSDAIASGCKALGIAGISAQKGG